MTTSQGDTGGTDNLPSIVPATVTGTVASVSPVKPRNKPQAPYLSKKRRVAIAHGMLVFKAAAYDDGYREPFERKGDDVILRVRLKSLNAGAYLSLKDTFDKGVEPYLLVDKSGLVVKMRDTVLSGQPIKRHSTDRILESLPKGTELPGGIKWSDFTDRQLVALALLSDVMSQNSPGMIASIVGVEQETIAAWEGNDRFLKVKKFLIERSTHKMREQYHKNIAQGMESDNWQERAFYTKMAGDRMGYTGAKGKVSKSPGDKDPALVADVQTEINEMSEAERKALADRLIFAATVVCAKEDGTLTAKAKEPINQGGMSNVEND